MALTGPGLFGGREIFYVLRCVEAMDCAQT